MDNKSRDIELEQRIDAYVKGRLSEDEAEQLWIQLMKQPEYIPLLETEVDLAKFHTRKQQATNDTSYYWKWIASAAAVILLFITINVLTTADQEPLNAWSINHISLEENLSSAEVTRSSVSALEPADSLLNAGFKAAVSGQNDSAIAIFEQIATNSNSVAAVSKAHLNLGILKYNSGNFSGSIKDFNKAISTAADDSLLIEQSYWYLGNAHLNTGQIKQARNAVEHAFRMGNIYKKEASKLLKRLDYELGTIDFDDFEQQMKENE